MGNQMFIYAAGLGIAQKYPRNFMCIHDMHETVNTYHPGSLLVQHVDILAKPLPSCSSETVQGIAYDWWWLTGYGWTKLIGLTTVFHPPPRRYTPFVFDARKPAIIDACLESYKYFQHVPQPIYRLKQAGQARAWLSARNLTSVVHVRRGDKFQNGELVAPLQFYERALRLLGTGRVAVCTDDPGWVMQQRVFENSSVSIHHDPGFDMALLTAATDTVIIGVGTFGWWGAYLSKAKTKLIYPKQVWPIYASHYSERDFIPHNVPDQGQWIALGI